MSIWDDPKITEDLSSLTFMKFSEPGDMIVGKISDIKSHLFPGRKPGEPDKVAPQLVLETSNGEVTVTAGQLNLKAQLVKLRPVIGDTIRIEYLKEKDRMKIFDVSLEKDTTAPPF